MKKSIILLLFAMSISLFLHSQVTAPLYMYLKENHYPYNFAPYDSILVLDDTIPQSNLVEYASLEYMDVGNTRYISNGKAGDSANTYEYRSASSANSYSVFKLLSGSTDTVSSIHFFHDQNGVDTASAEYQHQGPGAPDLFSYQRYYYRQDGLLDSLHYEGFKPGVNLSTQTSSFFYSPQGRLDSVISTKDYFGYPPYRFRNIFVYDAAGTLLYEEYYEDLGFGDQYFGRDIHRRNAMGQIVTTEKYFEVGGTYYLYQVHRYIQTPTFINREVNFTAVNVYPNPVSNFLYIQGLEESVHHYKIYNLQGQLINAGELESKGIDVRQLDKAPYLLELIVPGSAVELRVGFIRN